MGLDVRDIGRVAIASLAIWQTEQVSAAEVKNPQIPVFITATETVTASESFAQRLASLRVYLADTVTASDSQATLINPIRVASTDSVTISDSPTPPMLGTIISQIDTATVSESSSVQINKLLHSSIETATVSETASVQIDYLEIKKAEDVSASDSAAVHLAQLSIQKTETVEVADIPFAAILVEAPDYDALEISDSSSVQIAELFVAGSDSISIADTSAIRIAEAIQHSTDIVTVSDSFSIQVSSLRIQSTETVTLSEDGVADTSSAAFRSDQATVSDSAAVKLARLIIHQTEQVVATVKAYHSGLRLISRQETTTVSDSASVQIAALTIHQTEIVTGLESSGFPYTTVNHWLFDIGTAKYSTEDVHVNAVMGDYLGRVIPDSFSGVSLRWNIGSSALISPNEVSFDLFNGDGAISLVDIIGAECLITYGTGFDTIRKWRFYVKFAMESYGVIKVQCENYMAQFLEGDYPNTWHPKEIWPSVDTDLDELENYCVPVIFGQAFIPIMSAYTEDDDRFYVLGKGIAPTYDIERVRSPRQWPTTSWWDREMDINEILQVYLGEATGGTFTLTMAEKGEEWVLNLGGTIGGTYTLGDGATSETIDYDDSAAEVQAHLETVFGAGKVTVADGDSGEFDIAFPTAVADNIEESSLVADFDSLIESVRPYLTQKRTYCPGGTTGNLSYAATAANAIAIQTALEALCGEQVTVTFSGGIATADEWLLGAGEVRTWTAPADVYRVKARCFGGGGSGGSSGGLSHPYYPDYGAGCGGGGGAYAERTFTVSPGQRISYFFASSGYSSRDTYFYANGATGCLAKGGGTGGAASGAGPGGGGSASLCYGDVKYSGGNGAYGNSRYIWWPPYSANVLTRDGGGGGGGAGTTGDGTSGSGTSGGSGHGLYGGRGGNGGYITSSSSSRDNGDAGSSLGGGGGGGKASYASSATGGAGAAGGILLTYGGGAQFYFEFTSYVGESGMTANFDNLTGDTETPEVTELQAFVSEQQYDFEQSDSTDGEYKLCQFIIDDRNGDGAMDSNGLWLSGDKFLPALVKYSRSDTTAMQNPKDILEYVLEDFGLVEADLEPVSWAATEATLDTREVFFSGGMWEKDSRETKLASLLAQIDAIIYESDKIELHLFDSTPVETIDTTKTLKLSFKPTAKSRNANDGGRVEWHEAGQPQDILTGKAVAPVYNDQETIVNPAREVLRCEFLTSSISAKKAAILYFAKKFLTEGTDSFSTTVNKLSTVKTLIPGQVLTINDSMFGASHSIIVTNIDFAREGEVKISGARMSVIEDWDELSQDIVTVRESGTVGWQIFTADGTLNKIGMPTEDDLLTLNKGDFYTAADGTVKTVL